MKNIFDKAVCDEVINRINQLQPDAPAQWGKMKVPQMLAHCNVTYEMVYDSIHPKPGALGRFMMKLFVKNIVVSEKPYTQNNRTAPQFIIKNERDFNKEKSRLTEYIQRVQTEGASTFDGRESHSFGPLTSSEWNNLFYKHLDHHLKQFGV